MKFGKLNPQGRVNFPGFQEILDFTATGSESSVSVTVDGDTDKEYYVYIRSQEPSGLITLELNNDTGANYGYQRIQNVSGTLTSLRSTGDSTIGYSSSLELTEITLSTPASLIKTSMSTRVTYSSGTTIGTFALYGQVWNSTTNVTSLRFSDSSGSFTSGTRITVYARRSQS